MKYAEIINALCVLSLDNLDGELLVAAKLYRRKEITLKVAVNYMRYLKILVE